MIRKLLLPLVAALVLAVPSSATILILGAPTVTDLGGTFLWEYDVSLGNGSTLGAGPCTTAPAGPCDGLLTIYDFAGYQAGTVGFAPANPAWTWASNVALLGVTPLNTTLVLPDNPSLPNLTYEYTGPAIAAAGANLILGTAYGTSIYKAPILGEYSAQSGQLVLGNIVSSDNREFTQVPNIPEPGTVTLFGAALLGLAALRRRRS